MERVIERMMVADFREFIVTNISRPADEMFEHGHLVDEVWLFSTMSMFLITQHEPFTSSIWN